MKLSFFTKFAVVFFIFLKNTLSGAEISLENPDEIVKKANVYIESGKFQQKIESDNYDRDGIFGKGKQVKLSLENFIPCKIEFVLSHTSANVYYIINGLEGNWSSIIINVNSKGECEQRGHGSGGEKKVINKHPLPNDFIKNCLKKANKLFAEKQINLKNADWIESQEKNKFIFNKLRDKIPKTILSQDIILTEINWNSAENEFSLGYCIKPALFPKNTRSLLGWSLSIVFDGKGNLKKYTIESTSYSPDDYELNFPEPKLSEKEIGEIYVTVFKHMFVNAANWDQKVKIRFVSVDSGPLMNTFFKNFSGEKIPVRNPYLKQNDYQPEKFNKETGYTPNGEDALFYNIDRIIEFDKTHIFVSCSVCWHLMAARGYTYILEKQDGEWRIVDISFDWFS